MKVLIVFDKYKYTKNEILDDLEQLGFKYDYKFNSDIPYGEKDSYVLESDEIWAYGDVEYEYELIMGKQIGKPIWVMN